MRCRPWSLSVLLLAVPACTSPRPVPISVPALAAQSGSALPPSPLTFPQAVRFAVANAPDLAALRARAAAQAIDPPPEAIGVEVGRDADGRSMGSVSLDALSLLGIGPIQTERALARARQAEALLAHHERARAVAGLLAEEYAVLAALDGLPAPKARVDAAAYVRAGLESAAAEAAVAATDHEREAELHVRQAETEASRLRLRALLGLRPDAPLVLVPVVPSATWPDAPPATTDAILVTDASIQRLVGAYEVADAEVRRAVVAQRPGLELNPGIALDPTTFLGSVRLRLPIGLGSTVRAAEAAREAARLEVASAILSAWSAAAQERAAAGAAAHRLASARRRLETNEAIFGAARVRVEAGGGSLMEAIFAADGVVTATRDLRETAVEEARARVRAARANAWPTPGAFR